jgi:hypothetical protein
MNSPLQQLIGCSVDDVSFSSEGDDVVAQLPKATVGVSMTDTGTVVARTLAVLAPTRANVSDAVDAAIHQRCASTTAASHGSLSVHYEPGLRCITVTAVAQGAQPAAVAEACAAAATTAVHTRAWPAEILAIIEQRPAPQSFAGAPTSTESTATDQDAHSGSSVWAEPDPADLQAVPVEPAAVLANAEPDPLPNPDPAADSAPDSAGDHVGESVPPTASLATPSATKGDVATPTNTAEPLLAAVPPGTNTSAPPLVPPPTASVSPSPPTPGTADPLILPRETAPNPYDALTDSANTRARRARRLLPRRRGERNNPSASPPSPQHRQGLRFVVSDRDLTTGEDGDDTVVDLTVVEDVPDFGQIDDNSR